MASSICDFSFWCWLRSEEMNYSLRKSSHQVSRGNWPTLLFSDLIPRWGLNQITPSKGEKTWDSVTGRRIRIIRTSALWTWQLVSRIQGCICNKKRVDFPWMTSKSIELGIISKNCILARLKLNIMKGLLKMRGLWKVVGFFSSGAYRHMLAMTCQGPGERVSCWLNGL